MILYIRLYLLLFFTSAIAEQSVRTSMVMIIELQRVNEDWMAEILLTTVLRKLDRN